MNRNQSSRMSSAMTIKMFGPEFVAFGPVFSLFGSDFVLFGSEFVLQAASKVLALVSPIPSIARRPIACLRVNRPDANSSTTSAASPEPPVVVADRPSDPNHGEVRRHRLGSVVQSIGLTSSWQQVSAVYTPVAPGSSSLDFEAFTSNAPLGVCMQADDASITH